MPSRSQLYKIIAIVILLLVFLQYLYLFPVRLNLGYNNHLPASSSPLGSLSPTSSASSSSSLDVNSNLKDDKVSLFNFKTGPFYSKRSPDGLSSETQEQGTLGESTNAKEHPVQNGNYSRLKSVSIVSILEKIRHFSPTSPTPPHSSSSSSRISPSSGSLSSSAPVSKSHNANNGSELQLSAKFPLSQPSPSPLLLSSSSTPKPLPLLPFCEREPTTLLGYSRVALTEPPSLTDLGRTHEDIALGGHYKPPNCTSRDKVAIIVPFRDREEHLRLFLTNILPFLKRQQIDFNIFVIEQGGSLDDLFNRAMLFNVGFAEANKRGSFDCFIFHDVDLIPENDYNLYNCPVQPRHMSVAVDKMGYKLPYRNLFGGISALTKPHFLKVNGFSNSFWGWGAEDDDMAGRIAFNGLYISRPPPNIARYRMLKHKQQKLNTQRYRVLQKGKTRFKSDGLSSLKYSVEQVVLEKTYTLVRVKLVKP